MASPLSTAQVASRLNTTEPTVRSLLARKILKGKRVQRGTRFAWRIEAQDLEAYIDEHGTFDQRGARFARRLDDLERSVADLQRRGSTQSSADPPLHELEDLRVRVVALEEALTAGRVVSDLQKQADDERAIVIARLVEAIEAGERADAHRRRALAVLDDLVASLGQPGNARDLAIGPGR